MGGEYPVHTLATGLLYKTASTHATLDLFASYPGAHGGRGKEVHPFSFPDLLRSP